MADLIETTADQTAEIPKPPVLIDSRFMFVDVAALRAKQLRRGALPRVTPEHSEAIHKLERLAMEEVRRGLVDYSIPDVRKPGHVAE